MLTGKLRLREAWEAYPSSRFKPEGKDGIFNTNGTSVLVGNPKLSGGGKNKETGDKTGGALGLSGKHCCVRISTQQLRMRLNDYNPLKEVQAPPGGKS